MSSNPLMMGYDGGLLAGAACAGGRVAARIEPVNAGCGRWPERPGAAVSVMRAR